MSCQERWARVGWPDSASDELGDCQAGWVHSASCGKGGGVDLWVVACGLALEAVLKRGVGKVDSCGRVSETEVQWGRAGPLMGGTAMSSFVPVGLLCARGLG